FVRVWTDSRRFSLARIIHDDGAGFLVLLCYKKGSTKRTTGELSEQNACDGLSKRSNGPGVMPLRAHGANPEGGIAKALRGRVSPLDRLERRGKNGSVRPLGTHRPQYREWRDCETRASLVLHSGPVPVLASVLGN